MEAKRTPFYYKHLEKRAHMVNFSGFEMPLFYRGIVPEHLAVRASVGMFDLSHMGEFIVRGDGAFDFVQRMTTNDVLALSMYQIQYSTMCYDDGGIVDDLLVYRLPDGVYMLVV
ncbi:MAG: glycine cleavage system protein T, partial [candidate division Zixibacteria bacterium 4484_93]